VPRLITQLYTSTIYIQVGDRHFQIPRDIFSGPGDTPNYFSLGFAIFFSTPNEVFPGLDQRGLLRPPSILPPAVLNRSAEVFAELLHVLQGYPIHIRDEEHRAALLRDARYFHLKGLEQKLIPHQISFNHARQQSEIVMRLEDIRQSGVSFMPNSILSTEQQTFANSPDPPSSSNPSPAPLATSRASSIQPPQPAPNTPIHPAPGWVHYARPYVDSSSLLLILEIHSEATRLDLSVDPPRASFVGKTNDRIAALLSVVASKMNLPATAQPLGLMMLQSGGGVAAQDASPGNSGLSEERVKVLLEPSADVVVDGVKWSGNRGSEGSDAEEFEAIFEFEGREGRGRARKRRKETMDWTESSEGGSPPSVWIVRNGLWKLKVQTDAKGGMEIVFVAVKIEAFTGERARNMQRNFLG
jgi:hypothetical protein